MKQRIFQGLAAIFILFFGIGLYALWLFTRLGGAVDVILRENYQCVLAGQAMKQSAEGINFALSLALAGEEERGRKLFESYTPVFVEHLRHERLRISLPGERVVADKINQAEERYQGLAKFWNTSDLAMRRTTYFSELLPVFTDIQNNLQEVIRINEDNMVQANRKARALSANSTRTMLLVLVVAFLLPRVIGMRDESGNLFGAAVVLQDVTRFRLMDEVKTNLVSTVSHELKTPLSSIRMGVHLLLEEKIGLLNPKQLELLLAAREDSERLLRMINDLLDLARLESGQTRQRFEIISTRTLIKKAASDLKPLVEANDARLVTDIAPKLPDVAVDLRQIGHVFSNLVSNAARYSRPGEDVVLSAKPIGNIVRFTVLDHGPGIPKEFQSRIFERFFRIPGTQDSTGVGLGLAIAREMIVSHGGSIGLQTTLGKGSEFYFDLPTTSNGVKA